MMFGIIPIRFRFRGKLRRLARIYQCFLDHPSVGLHPTQIARYTGIGFQEVSARLDPLVPFVSDTVGHLEDLLRHIRSAGVTRASASYLVLRPDMLELFEQALPVAHFQMVKGSFKRQPWRKVGVKQTTKLLPEQTRAEGYQRLRNIGKRLGVEVTVCSCQNPSLGTSCLSRPKTRNPTGPTERGQLSLFNQ